MTSAEIVLWKALRAHRFKGIAFRRQTPIGPFIVDFVCHQVRLVIEVDGGQHATASSDVKRDAWLSSQGYTVLRFWNNEVLGNLSGVLHRIDENLPPLPNPPPLGGGDCVASGRKQRL